MFWLHQNVGYDFTADLTVHEMTVLFTGLCKRCFND